MKNIAVIFVKILNIVFCKHNDLKFVRNIGGDEQMIHYVKGGGLARSQHKCTDCGRTVYRGYRC